MSKRRTLPWGARLRAAASIITMGAVSTGRYGPLVNASHWSRDLSDVVGDLYVDEHVALNVSAVWACSSLLADTLSQLPAGVFKKEGEKRTPLPDHPASRLLSGAVNDAMGRRGFVKVIELHRQLGGNGFAQVERDGGKPVGLWPLRSATPKRRENGTFYYEATAGGERIELAASDVVHIRGLSNDGVTGMSPIAAARSAIGVAMHAEKFGSDFFRNEAKSGGFLLHPGKLSQKAKDNVVDSLTGEDGELATSRKRSHRLRVLEEGMKFIPTSIAPEEAQFLATRQFQVEEIARWYRVPLVLIQSVEKTSSWGAGVEQLMIAFSQFTVSPLAQSWEEELSLKLLTDEERAQGIYIRLDLRGLLRGDMAARSAFYASGIQHQWLTPNEVRAREELDPLEGGDVAVDRPPPASPGDRP